MDVGRNDKGKCVFLDIKMAFLTFVEAFAYARKLV